MTNAAPPMQKLINAPGAVVDEMLEGIFAAHGGDLRRGTDPRSVVLRSAPLAGKVAVATGGGSGHLPLFLGYVGAGLVHGCAVGDVFSSPSAEQMLAVLEDIHAGAGALIIQGNYSGDVMNFSLAAELAAERGITVTIILGADDVLSAPRDNAADRRGIAGIAFLYKVAGAAAASGADLDQVTAVTARAAAGLASVGVALSSCTIPSVGRPTFEVAPGTMEVGMGIHGEPGIGKQPLAPADDVADLLVRTVAEDLGLKRGERVDVLLNGLGATPGEELYIVYRSVADQLGARGVEVRRARVGAYATALEMAGASLSILRVDDELAALLDAPSSAPLLALW